MPREVADRLRAMVRAAMPLEARVWLRRAPFVVRDLLAPAPVPRASDRGSFAHVQCERRTPLRRANATYDEGAQRAKEQNVALGAALVDGAVIAPGATFSWHRCVGPPLRARGFRDGPELHGGRLEPGLGGGLCQVSNLVYWLALHAGLEVLERHRHALDLFPDHERTAPFGCGATVYYPGRDLKIRNPHHQPALLETWLESGFLHGRVRLPRDPGVRWEVVETEHRFVRDEGVVFRENRLVLRRHGPGTAVRDEPLARNRAQVAYAVPEGSLEPGPEEAA